MIVSTEGLMKKNLVRTEYLSVSRRYSSGRRRQTVNLLHEETTWVQIPPCGFVFSLIKTFSDVEERCMIKAYSTYIGN